MSNTELRANSPLAVKNWGRKDWIATMQKTAFGLGFARGSVFVPPELIGERAVGDNVTYSYIGQLIGKGITENQALTGNEKALDLGNHTISMNETWQGVLNPGKNNIQSYRSYVDFDAASRSVMRDWFARQMDIGYLYQLAGANPNSLTINGSTYTTPQDKLVLFGHNTPVEPSADRVVRAGAVPNDQSLTSANKMTLTLIDYALELAESSDNPIEPHDDGTYDFYLSNAQMVDLKNDTNSPIQWFPIQLAMLEGGRDNALDGTIGYGSRQKAVGRYGQVNLVVAPRTAYGVNSATGAVITTVRRAVLVGKNALTFASPFGGRRLDNDVPIKYVEQARDYGRWDGVGGVLIYGMKKTKPTNGSEVGSIVVSTYAAAHA